MTADPHQVMRILDHRGIDVRLVDGRLIGRSRHGIAIPEDISRFIHFFKATIIAELQSAEKDLTA